MATYSLASFALQVAWTHVLSSHILRLFLLALLLPLLVAWSLLSSLFSFYKPYRPPPAPPSSSSSSSRRYPRSSISSISSASSSTSAYATQFTDRPLPPVPPLSVIRTPRSRFSALLGWDYRAKYFDIENGLRVAYIDEGGLGSRGASSQPVVVCFHGVGGWGYTFRRLVPQLVAAGMRVYCFDLPGFGQSDKPVSPSDHSVILHVNAISAFLTRIVLSSHLSISSQFAYNTDITLIGCGYGSTLVSLALKESGNFQDSIRRVVLLSPYLPPLTIEDIRLEAAERIYLTMGLIRLGLQLPISDFLSAELHNHGGRQQRKVKSTLSSREREGYDAPFPTSKYRAGPSAVPFLLPLPLITDPLIFRLRQLLPLHRVPILGRILATGDDIRRDLDLAKDWVLDYAALGAGLASLSGSTEPMPPNSKLLVMYGENDSAFGDTGRWLKRILGPSVVVGMEGVGHFVLDDAPKRVHQQILSFIKSEKWMEWKA